MAIHEKISVAPAAGIGPELQRLLIRNQRSTGGATQEMLKSPFGLTPTEGQLATLLGEGGTLERAAVRLGQATGTERIHLKSIFRKISVGRQQELVGLTIGLISQVRRRPVHLLFLADRPTD